ncbi:MAG: ABC transporter permease subunit [Burkholderiales bacterium]|nr:ABC transporter permease subunit [Burkholderiales bacterium]
MARWRGGRLVAGALLAAAGVAAAAAASAESVVVGSKRFTESYILAEIVARVAAPHAQVTHRQGLGNTAIVFAALKAGAIDLYPDYTGTLAAEVLKLAPAASLADLRAGLAPLGLGLSAPLGFHNGYALALRRDEAQRRRLARLSDLKAAPDLKLALSHEFLGRADGWPGLAARYGLPHRPAGIDHGLAYDALARRSIDVTDIYTTDAKIARQGLAVLQDDLGHFPRYDAVLVHRLDLAERAPRAWRAIEALAGRIDEPTMIGMNAAAELDGRPFAAIAAEFVAGRAGGATRAGFADKLFGPDFARLLGQHVLLVAVAVAVAGLVGVPLGVLAAGTPALTQPVLAAAGILQTIPSLALLAMLIPLLGDIGTGPALVALSLYALLPIVQNTCTGLGEVPGGLKQAALSLGLTPRQRLTLVELPLALPVILAGARTAAVTTVGTATIAAFIGAGGFGERIATGLALNDHATLLAGALPAAALALATQAAFASIERAQRRRRTR